MDAATSERNLELCYIRSLIERLRDSEEGVAMKGDLGDLLLSR